MYPEFRDETPLRSWAALAGALLVHGAVAGLVFFSAAREPQLVAPTDVATAAEVEIEMAAERAMPDWPAAVPSSESSEASSTTSRRSIAARAEPRSERNVPAPSNEGSPPGSEDGYALDPTAQRGAAQGPGVELGISPGDWSRWVDPTARVEAPRPPRNPNAPPASTTGGVAEALEAHDREVGLGPAGPIISAAHEAGHDPVAPAIGTARFSITVMKSGGVEVSLVGVSSNAEGWRKVADKMALAIKRRPPRIEGGRNGVRIGLELVAEERWPNGSVARSEGPALAFSFGSVQASDKAVEDLSKRNPFVVAPSGTPVNPPGEERPAGAPLKLNIDPPGLSIKGRGKVCSYQIALPFPLIAGGCDPSNIGAAAQRVVSAKVIDQTML